MTDVIGFHYTLKNDANEVLDSSDGGDPMLYLAGSGQILPVLDKELASMSVGCLLYTSPSPRDATLSRMPSSA